MRRSDEGYIPVSTWKTIVAQNQWRSSAVTANNRRRSYGEDRLNLHRNDHGDKFELSSHSG